MTKRKIKVQSKEIMLFSQNKEDYISLTDIAKYQDPDRTDYIIQNWMRNKDTVEFLGLWEKINNPKFKPIEFDGFWKSAGLNSFTLTPKKWIQGVSAIGIISKSGRGGGTYAHQDIAFEFASWISAEFKLYLIIEFQRLKELELEKEKLGWNAKRHLASVNYKIHTDAIKKYIIPHKLSGAKKFVYASEADLLNIALFGMTAAEWKKANPDKEGNIRDHAHVTQLVCLANLENLNALFIKEGLSSEVRLQKLNEIAIEQIVSLVGNPSVKKIEKDIKNGPSS